MLIMGRVKGESISHTRCRGKVLKNSDQPGVKDQGGDLA